MKNLIFLISSMMISLNAEAIQVEKSDWINQMKTALPTYFCQSDQLFRQCYTVSANECQDVAYTATNVCLKKMDEKIPKKINMPEQGEKLGGDLGECAGTTYSAVLNNKRIKSATCNKLIFGK
jgi:hypothetical protein